MTKNKGFTLIELLVVLTIITILTGAALAALTGFRASARDTRRIADVKNTQTYLELYFNKCGRYPGDSTCGSTNPTSWAELQTALGTVMNASDVPVDPVPSRTYLYGVDSAAGQEGLRYVVGATLERDNSVMQRDSDGTVFGQDCGQAASDTVYCVES